MRRPSFQTISRHGAPFSRIGILLAGVLAMSSAYADPQPFFQAHCYACHGAERQKADLNLEALLAAPHPFADPKPWERVLKMLSTGEMPPEEQPRPAPEDIQQALREIQKRLDQAQAHTPAQPGRVAMRHLNRAEYNNTVRDLLGTAISPADAFPPDDTGYGFDTIADVLSLSPLLMEKYLAAAETLSNELMQREASFYCIIAPRDRRLFVCNHELTEHTVACCQENLRQFTRRAFRRPPTEAELSRLMYFLELALANGDSLLDGMQTALQAVLVSPQFLFRIEEEPPPGTSSHAVSQYELASRLSYFLWSSMPDEELLSAAEAGELLNPLALRLQIARMLTDHKARALAQNFGGQWLEFRNLARSAPNPDLYPEADQALRKDMAEESILFLLSIFQEDRSLLDFLSADYTFANERLAKHYRLKGIAGPEFRRVAVDSSQRGGVLTQASVLTVTSYPTRTSPVLRGVWVLKNLLDAPPPPPPPNVPALDQAEVDKTAPLRQRLEAHRKDPACASCHSRMDPLGFGLENYDAVGAWRTREGNHEIDAGGVLPGGQAFRGAAELKAILLARKDEFVRCLTEKMLIYALGRGLEQFDRPAVEEILERLQQRGYHARALIEGIVESTPFQQRQAQLEAQ